MRRSRRWGGFLLISAIALGGCDGSGGAPPVSSSMAKAQVKGKVSQKGKPLAGIDVNFNPANISRKDAPMVTTKVKEDGTYEITTLVGENTVTLGGTRLSGNTQAQYYSKSIDVKEGGDNTLDIEVQ